jgi:hypothetical protein
MYSEDVTGITSGEIMRLSLNQARTLFLCGCIGVVSGCDDRSPTGPGLGVKYPTTLVQLSPDSLLTAKELFASENPRICSSLNEYGFTVGPLCYEQSLGVGDDPDLALLAQMAKDAVLRNSRFTGVVDSLYFYGAGFFAVGSSIRDVQFRSQKCEGLWVMGTRITARLDTVGVLSIQGNHYRDIYIPRAKLSAREAQQSIIGMPLRYWDEHGKQTRLVDHHDFYEQPSRVVLPVKRELSMELRVAWRIPVSYKSECWFVYIDSVWGDSLDVFGPYGGCP